MFYAFQARRREDSKLFKKFQGKKYFWIKFPTIIDINGKDRKGTLRVIEQLKEEVLRGRTSIGLDFSGTHKIIAPGMIAIYAELSNIMNGYPDLRFHCRKEAKDTVRQVLTQIGIYAMCRQKSFSKNATHSDVVHWRVCSGVGVIVDRINKVLTEEERDLLNQVADIYGGCTEATKNALRHAYPKQRTGIPVDREKTDWWCFSQVKDGEFMLLICDLGVSIPYTIPRNFPDLWETFKSAGMNTDAKIIEGALKRPRSRSGESHRGNGLPKMMEVAKAGGRLTIYSGRGVVQAFDSELCSKNYRHPLLGTIISFVLPLGEKA